MIDDLDRVAVRDMMIGHPKTLASDATVGDVRRFFVNQHVHLALLTDGAALRGTLIRDDLIGVADHEPALGVSSLVARTITADVSMKQAHQILADTDARRLAVVNDHGALLGLLCLKRRRTGFCSEADLADRSRERGGRQARS